MNYKNMSDTELASEIRKIQNELALRDDGLSRYLKRHCSELYFEIENRTPDLNKYRRSVMNKGKVKRLDVSIFERIYCLENGLKDRPLCKMCGKSRVNRFLTASKTYGKWCSPKCQASDPDCISMSKHTRKELHGDENYNGVEKSRKTRERKNGGNWHAEDFFEKAKATKVAHGHEPNWNNTEKRCKTISVMVERNPNYWKDRDEKIKATKVSNGHDANWNNREQFKKTIASFSEARKDSINAKRADTCEKTYGVNCVAKIPGVTEKKRDTCRRLYGVDSALCLEISHERSRMTLREDTWDNYISKRTDVIPMMSRKEYVTCKDILREWKWRCAKCGNEFESTWHDGHTGKCPACYPITKRGIQNEVAEYVHRITGDETRTDVRDVIYGYELDIVDERLKVAVEVDGLFWHTNEGSVISYASGTTTDSKPISYHLEKTELCESAGYRLVHFTDDEWRSNRKLCEAVLRRVLGVGKHREFRNCAEVKKVPRREKAAFLTKYSFSGDCCSSVDIGLYVRGKLASVMCFSKTRHSPKYEWQLMRYAEMNFVSVENGFEKLLAAFEAEYRPESVVFYVDRRFYSVGDFSGKMRFAGSTRPCFYWVNEKGTEKYKPHEFTKANIENYDSTKTFLENMHGLGYKRYFDCGNLVFEKTYRSEWWE